LRFGFNADQQNAGAEDPGRYGRTRSCTHRFPPCLLLCRNGVEHE
jgi:hypothetical protein